MPVVAQRTHWPSATYESVPLLTAEQERWYIARVQHYRDVEAQAYLIRANIGWVTTIARRRLQPDIELEDLLQEGCIGLLKAVDRFDLSSPFRLTTYSGWWILQTIDRYIGNCCTAIRLPLRLQPVVQAVKQAEVSESDERLREHSPEQIALVRRAIQSMHSLDDPLPYTHSGELTLAEVLPDDDLSTEEEVLHSLFTQEIHAVLEQVLTEREIRILTLRNGLQETKAHTLEQVGKLEGITRERVRQLEEQAHRKLRRSATLKALYEEGTEEGFAIQRGCA